MSTDAARSILSDPRAPAGERFDARAELEAAYRPTASDLIPAEAFAPVLNAIRGGEISDELAKARGLVVPFRGQGRPASQKGHGGMRGVRLDEGSALMIGDQYVEKHGAVDFNGLRRMVEGTPILAAVVTTRIRQMMRFCNPSEDGGPGFEIRHVDKDHEATDAEKAEMKQITRFIQNGGWEFNPRARKRLKRDTFATFMAKQVRDSLTFDATPIETEFKRNSNLGMDGFYALDGATIRLCSEEGYEGDDEVFALQVVQGKVRTTFTMDQLVYEVRNPRSDVSLGGYGQGETELLLRVCTALLQAHAYNQDFFDKNSVPKGLLQIFGDYSKEDASAFKRHWQSMVQGVENRHALPVLVGKDRETGAIYTPFNDAASEMAFAKWMTFLTSLICAIYTIDPSEIGFESFAAAKSTLSGNDTSEKMANSKDKGFRPLASHFEGMVTDFIVADHNPDFCLRFAGMEEDDKQRAWEAKKLVATVDEVRAEEGMTPHQNPKIGALPVNPALIQPALQLSGEGEDGDFGAEVPEQQEEGEPDFGAERPEPDGSEPDFGAAVPEDDGRDPDFGTPGAGLEGGAPLPEPAPGPNDGGDFGAEPPPPKPAAKPAPRKKVAKAMLQPGRAVPDVPAPRQGGNDFARALRASAFWRIRGPWSR